MDASKLFKMANVELSEIAFCDHYEWCDAMRELMDKLTEGNVELIDKAMAPYDNPEYYRGDCVSLLTGLSFVVDDDDDGQQIARAYIGSFINPSGKYYMPWACSNVNGWYEVAQDETFWAMLDVIADEMGGFIDSGEGCATDVFFNMPVDVDDDETSE